MLAIDKKALDLFRSQAGVLSRAQAVALGYTPRQIGHRVKTGEWLVIRRGVYRLRAFELSDRMSVFALTLGGAGYASHRYAARLHGLEPELQAAAEVTVKRGRHLYIVGDGAPQHWLKTDRSDTEIEVAGLPKIRVHESTQTGSAKLMVIDGLQVSGVERTIMDVAAVEPRQWWILALMDSAKRKGLTSDEEMINCLKRHARRGRDGTVRFRAAIEAATQTGAPAIGHLSRKVASLVAGRGVPYPFFEEPVFDREGIFIAQGDLSFDMPVVAMLDGFGPHKTRRQMNRDRQQRQRMREQGLWVPEFMVDQISMSPASVANSLIHTYRIAEAAVRNNPSNFRWWTERRMPRRPAS